VELRCGPEPEDECLLLETAAPGGEAESDAEAVQQEDIASKEEAPDVSLLVEEGYLEQVLEEIPPEERKERREGKEGGEEGWFGRLRKGLSKSRLNLMAPLSRAVAGRRYDEDFWEEVEDILIGADVGMEMTTTLVQRVKERMASEKVKDPEGLMALFREVLADALDVGERELRFAGRGPSVFMVVGVNGTGKTTTIAKLAHLLRLEGKRVLLAAGDTFRAAGIEQLEAWGERVGVHTVKHRQGADAAAVVHDAVESSLAREIDVVIADTAGRLHTKTNLMEELKKIKRVAERKAQVTETLLVIDATTGQNGLIQARQFREAVEVSGVVLTKLDGTAKGGIVVAIVHDLGIPIKFIGVGEDLDDLHPFDPREFASALFS
jgi:fused signal recognition particle receptor